MNKPVQNNLVIELHVPDFDKVKDFYGKLGFEQVLEDEVNEEGPGYLTMTHRDPMGDTMLCFYGGDERVYNQSYFKNFSRDTKRAYASEVTMIVENVDAAYVNAMEKLKDYVVKPLQETVDRQVSWRDFRMEDPFGFYLRITSLVDMGQE